MLQLNDLVTITSLPAGRNIPNDVLGQKARISHVSKTGGKKRYNLVIHNSVSPVRKLSLIPASCLKRIDRPKIEKAVPNSLNVEIRDIRIKLKSASFSERINLHKRLAYLISQSDGKL